MAEVLADDIIISWYHIMYDILMRRGGVQSKAPGYTFQTNRGS
jgi:hypothetical protein